MIVKLPWIIIFLDGIYLNYFEYLKWFNRFMAMVNIEYFYWFYNIYLDNTYNEITFNTLIKIL